jgi:replication factor A3
MDLAAPAPRVNGELLARFVGRRVLLVGKAESMEGSALRVRTSDDRVVSVELKSGTAGAASDYIEFEAVVVSQDSVREEEHTNFGANFGAPAARGVQLAVCASPCSLTCLPPPLALLPAPLQTWGTTTSWSSS